MRAAYIEEYGPPSVIRYGELPDPRPGPTDVLVDVDAVAVDPVDTFVRSGAWRTPLTFPFVIGRDLVGTVAEAGPGTPGFAPGDRVWSLSMGHEGRQGPSAERAVVPADRLYRLPDDTDPLDLLAMAHPAATAHLALFTHGRLRPGETVVVHGAAGNVGGAMVVMAANAGARVVAVASGADAAYCRDLGAVRTVDYRAPDVPARIAAACGDGADLILDASGRNDLEQAVNLLARRGRIIVLSGMTARPVLPVAALYQQDRSITGFAISHATTTELAEAAHHVAHLTATGLLRPRHRTTLPLSEAAEAHHRLESGEGSGHRFLLQTPTPSAP
ncbi:NADPH:quinone reductase [Actinocorallia libanotica]|uniref:Zinc-binding dehydrogenase n=1 Tax=Actinocorallia libanotica TaxID=46162 RepID=A0ABN1RSS2_9ACTN